MKSSGKGTLLPPDVSLNRARGPYPTATEAMRWIDSSKDLRPRRRAAFKVSLSFLSRATGQPLEKLVLDPREIGRTGFAASAEALGLTDDSVYTYHSNLRTLFYQLGLIDNPRRSSAPLPPAWAALRDSLPNDRYMSMWLQSFMAFCAEAGVVPDRVTDATVAAYREHLTSRRLARHPGQQARKAAKAWNHAAETVPSWPAQRLRAPTQNRIYSLPLTAYPESFQKDVDRFLQRMTCEGDGGLYTSGGRRDPARPATVRARYRAILMAAAALVHSGMPIAEITSLSILVEHLKTINTWHWRRAGERASRTAKQPIAGKVTKGTGQIADTLRVIAKHHLGLTGAALAEVTAATKVALPPRRSRMTAKNEKRLLQFEDPTVEARLLHLPSRLLREAHALHARNHSLEAAWLAGVAVAVEIELFCPMRIKNLTELRIGHELVRLDSRGKHWTHILVAAEDGKTDVPLNWPIAPESARVIDTYLKEFRPLLPHSGSTWLFPGRDDPDRPRHRPSFGMAISDAIRKFIGIEMNTHFFRAFAGAQILADNPGALQDLRLVLGHKTLHTSLQYYTSSSAKTAARNLGRLVTRKRSETRLAAAAAFRKPKRTASGKPA